ncbi:NFACT RNA binding domain-containing protein [Hugenholtzia roseola]|uniref:NFACT RNA binding domain-containing protein n=1 Tax=Hugenholtzia roseola TaxID=1002 RepID=UPI000414983F|nr:NFACT RNA binding domain-containing protein [Hugenholtzia roseola]
MHHNYYFLTALAQSLNHSLVGFEIQTAFSQNKDELLIGFSSEREKRDFWLRFSLLPELTTLSFPTDFARAKRNSIDLFPDMIGLEVERVYVFENERALGIDLKDSENNNKTLVCKFFSASPNLLLFEGETVIDLFIKSRSQDWDIEKTALHKKRETTWEAFQKQGVGASFPTLGKELLKELGLKSDETSAESWEILQDFFFYLKRPTFYLLEKQGQISLSFFEKENILYQTQDPIEAANRFYSEFSKTFYLQKEKQKALKSLEKKLRQTQNYIEKNYEKLDQIQSKSRYEEIGHILMANLHLIQGYEKEVTLFDFYQNQNIVIPLKAQISPQKNAENFYRKAKNQKIEIKKLEENIAQKEKEAVKIQKHLNALDAITSLKNLRQYLKTHQIKVEQGADSQEDALPFKQFESEGFQIWVGKNAKNNDLLTQRFAYKEDLWFHARGVAGSHVILKYRAGKPFPKSAITVAAQIAAYYSKSKTDTLVPVIVTPKKFVRKPKGAEVGAVLVEREEVVMVEPQLPVQGV